MEVPFVFNIFGSATSRDIDFLVVINHRPSIEQCKQLAREYEERLAALYPKLTANRELDCNLCMIEEGVITWVYKGMKDITNNAVLATYHLHQQYHPCLIQKKLVRNLELFKVRTIGIILAHVTRSSIRGKAREALRGTFQDHLFFLSALDFEAFTYNAKRTNATDNYKTIAFQIGQLSSLLDGKELFTKEDIGAYDTRLFLCLQRKPSNLSDLTAALHDVVKKCIE